MSALRRGLACVAWGPSAVRRRRTGGASQGGFALMLALGVMAMTFLTSVALLGLALTASRVTVAQTEGAMENRAADGALEAAVARLARTSAGAPCAAVPQGSTVDFADPGGATIPVEVSCDLGVADPAKVDLPLGGPGVYLLGSSGPDGDLRHTGTAALPFDADVTVRTSANATVTPNGPAVTLTGQYQQGRAAIGLSGADCGPLATAGTQQIVDRNSVPECGVNLGDPPASVEQLVAPGTQSLATVPSSCSTVMAFDPGRYTPSLVAALNNLIATCNGSTFWFKPASVGIGVHEFDANDPSSSVAARRTGLVIDNPTVSVVFGQPLGWDPASGGAGSAFPRACDPTVSGASIQLSGRTAIKHLAGRVAACPARSSSNTALPALVQVPTAETAPDGTMVSSEFTRNTATNPFGNVLDPTVRASATYSGCPFPNTQCTLDRTVVTSWRDFPSVPLASAKLLFRSKETPPVTPSGASRRVDLTFTSAAGTTLGTCGFDQGRTQQLVTALDLLGPGCTGLSGRQATELEGSRLTARFRFTNPQCYASPGQCISMDLWDMRLEVNGVVGSGQSVASGSGWNNSNSANNVLVDDTAIATPSQPTLCAFPFASDPRCRRDTPGVQRTVRVQDVRFPSGSALADGTAPIDSLAVMIRNNGAGVSNGSYVSDPIDESSIMARLTLQGGASCEVMSPGFSNSFQITRIDLQDGCKAIVNTASDLTDADITLTFTSNCAWYGGTRAPVSGSPAQCDQVTVPRLQYVGLAATTNRIVSDTPPTEATVDVTGAGGRVAEFHVFGNTNLPRTQVQLHWRGTSRAAGEFADTPLFGGSLLAQGIVSDMSAGVQTGTVCCTPAGSPVRLTATVNGRVRATAVVESVAVPSSLVRRVRVLDWSVGGA